MEFQVVRCQDSDIPRLTEIFDGAAAFQRRVSEHLWLGFERERLEAEIGRGEMWKVTDGGQVACAFVCVRSDTQIWENSESDRAIYLHRIAVAEEYRGKGCMEAILDWAKGTCAENGWEFVRVDTWARNEKLVGYYLRLGFEYVREFDPTNVEGLPAHYGEPLALLEMKVGRCRARIAERGSALLEHLSQSTGEQQLRDYPSGREF